MAEVGCIGGDGEYILLFAFAVESRDQEFLSNSHGSFFDVF